MYFKHPPSNPPVGRPCGCLGGLGLDGLGLNELGLDGLGLDGLGLDGLGLAGNGREAGLEGRGFEGGGLTLGDSKSVSKLLLKPKFPWLLKSVKVTGPKSGPTVFPKLSPTGWKSSMVEEGLGLGRGPADCRVGCLLGGLGWDGNLTIVGPGINGNGFRMFSGAGTSCGLYCTLSLPVGLGRKLGLDL